jgi:hypothetical protein
MYVINFTHALKGKQNSTPGANPTSYNASSGKTYNTISSLVHFENQNVSSTLKNALCM